MHCIENVFEIDLWLAVESIFRTYPQPNETSSLEITGIVMIDIRLCAVLDFVCVQGQLHRFCTDQGLRILSPPLLTLELL